MFREMNRALRAGLAPIVTIATVLAASVAPAAAVDNLTPPASVSAATGAQSGTVSVQWTAVTAASAYTVLSSPGSKSCTAVAPETSCTVSGLTGGAAYKFKVMSLSEDDSSGWSTWTSSTTAGADVPTTVASVNATGADRVIAVTWALLTGIGTRGSAITGYVAAAFEGASSMPAKTCEAAASATSCSISGLTNGITYTVKVAASNGVGQGPFSAGTFVIPAGAPAPVSNLTITATARDALTATWTPADANGAAPVAYAVTVRDADGNVVKAETSLSTPTFTISSVDLTKVYRFAVIASNRMGESDPSTASSTAATAPGKVTGLAAEATSDTSARVSWGAASANGVPASAVDYKIVVKDSDNKLVDGYPQMSNSTSFNVTGLSAAKTYFISVAATTIAGTGEFSDVRLDWLAPAAPTAVVATAGDRVADISWTAATTRGSAVIGYRVTATPGGSACETTTLTACRIEGLSNGTSYTFNVVAVSALGQSATSSPSSAVTPSGKPFAVASVVAEKSGKGSITRVSWTAANGNGAAVSSYEVTASTSGESAITKTVSGTSASFDFVGLKPGAPYVFSVVAVNLRGKSDPVQSASYTPVATVPGTIVGASMKRGFGTATFTVTGIDHDGGLPAKYTVRLTPAATTCVITPDITGAGSCTISGLDNATLYSATVTAANSIGEAAPVEIEPAFDVWVSGATVAKGGKFTAYFVGAQPRATVKLVFGSMSKPVKVSASGSGSIEFTVAKAGVNNVWFTFGTKRVLAGSIWTPAISLPSKSYVGLHPVLTVLYAASGSTVQITRVDKAQPIPSMTVPSGATGLTFEGIDTTAVGTVKYSVTVNGVLIGALECQVKALAKK